MKVWLSRNAKRLAALTLALGVTLTACSDDDTKDDKLIPEIEVTQSLTFDCTQTQTKNLEIELNGKLNWQIKADAWIELSQTSGKGSATVAVTVPANATSRTGTITVTATGYRHGHMLRKADQRRGDEYEHCGNPRARHGDQPHCRWKRTDGRDQGHDAVRYRSLGQGGGETSSPSS